MYIVLKSWVMKCSMITHGYQLRTLCVVRSQKQPYGKLCSQGSARFQRRLANAHVPSYRMVANLACDSLDEITYSASLSGLRYSLDSHFEGLSICVYGYQDKLPLLLQVVLEKVNNLQVRVDRLDIFKEKVRVLVPVKCAGVTA